MAARISLNEVTATVCAEKIMNSHWFEAVARPDSSWLSGSSAYWEELKSCVSVIGTAFNDLM